MEDVSEDKLSLGNKLIGNFMKHGQLLHIGNKLIGNLMKDGHLLHTLKLAHKLSDIFF